MTQRNPMNERYSSEERTGVARKSAASAKPKAKAAASVVVTSNTKTPQQKKAEAKAARKKEAAEQRELDRKYYTPDTQRYRTLRRIWWACLVGAVVCTLVSWFARELDPLWISMVGLVGAYALIIAAFYVDFSKIRKERREYQARMIALEEKQKKEQRAAARAQQHSQKHKGSGKNASRNPKTQAHAAESKAHEAAAEEQAGDGVAADAPNQKKALFGGLFKASKGKGREAAANGAAAAGTGAGAGTEASDDAGDTAEAEADKAPVQESK